MKFQLFEDGRFINTGFCRIEIKIKHKAILHGLGNFANIEFLHDANDGFEFVVLGKNGIIEQGTHEELINKNGVYASMYNASLIME